MSNLNYPDYEWRDMRELVVVGAARRQGEKPLKRFLCVTAQHPPRWSGVLMRSSQASASCHRSLVRQCGENLWVWSPGFSRLRSVLYPSVRKVAIAWHLPRSAGW